MTERELQAAVLEAARLCGYAVHHTRPARTLRGWRTPIAGDAGFPDLVLCGRGRLLVRELKVGGRRPTPEQSHWLELLRDASVDAGVWTEEDWLSDRIIRELQAPAPLDASWLAIARASLEALSCLLDALATAELSERDERTVCELRSQVADALALVQELAP